MVDVGVVGVEGVEVDLSKTVPGLLVVIWGHQVVPAGKIFDGNCMVKMVVVVVEEDEEDRDKTTVKDSMRIWGRCKGVEEGTVRPVNILLPLTTILTLVETMALTKTTTTIYPLRPHTTAIEEMFVTTITTILLIKVCMAQSFSIISSTHPTHVILLQKYYLVHRD